MQALSRVLAWILTTTRGILLLYTGGAARDSS